MSANQVNADQDFFQQLKEWSVQARASLEAGRYAEVSRLMFLIRGTSRVFGYFQIAYLAGLGEGVARYSIPRENARSMRKCIDSIWDALTTLEHMISVGVDSTSEEQKTVIRRLEETLKTFDQSKLWLNQTEIDVIVRSYGKHRDLARQGG